MKTKKLIKDKKGQPEQQRKWKEGGKRKGKKRRETGVGRKGKINSGEKIRYWMMRIKS